MPHLNGETVSQIPVISKCDAGMLDFSISPRSAAPAGATLAGKCKRARSADAVIDRRFLAWGRVL
jgi:hypothetical protein